MCLWTAELKLTHYKIREFLFSDQDTVSTCGNLVSALGKSAVRNNGARTASVMAHAGVGFLNSLVADRVIITFRLHSYEAAVEIYKQIDALITCAAYSFCVSS